MLIALLAGLLAGGGAAYAALLSGGFPAAEIVSPPAALRWLLAAVVASFSEQAAQAIGGEVYAALPRGELWDHGIAHWTLAGGVGAFSLAGIAALNLALRVSRPRRNQRSGGCRQQRKSRDGMEIPIGPLDLPRRVEPRHLLAVGSTGSGKSQTVRAAAVTARRRGNPALVLDVNGELMGRLYREGIDTILGIYDQRSVAWSPLAEMTGEHDSERIAAMLVPMSGGEESRTWCEYARTYTEGILVACWRWSKQGQRVDNELLAQLIANADADKIRDVLGPDHPASGLLRPGNERMAGSAIAIAASSAKAIRGLHPRAGFRSWSISEWASKAALDDGSWLFVPVPIDKLDAASLLASMVSSFAIDSVLCLPEDEDRRFFFLVDELGQYPAISALSRSLTLGRKYGLVAVHAVQMISQLQATYGQEGCTTLLGNYGHKIIFRCGDGDTAEWASREIGDAQIRRVTQSVSNNKGGLQGGGSSSTSEQEQIVIERSVLPSEIQDMPDLQAYFRSMALRKVPLLPIDYVALGKATIPAFVGREERPARRSKPHRRAQKVSAEADKLPPVEQAGEGQKPERNGGAQESPEIEEASGGEGSGESGSVADYLEAESRD